MANGLALVVTISAVAGWGDGGPLLVWGKDLARGHLVNVSPGYLTGEALDPAKPTVVIVHGVNPCPKVVHYHIAHEFARSVVQRGGPALNVAGWDWNAGTVVGLSQKANIAAAVAQGRSLAYTLKATGVSPSRVHLVGQSTGGIVAASAARAFATEMGEPVAHLTLLDPATFHHETIFGTLAAGTAAPIVENFWASGPSGYGRAVDAPGVRNMQVDGPTPYLGTVWPLRSSHFYTVQWYIATAQAPTVTTDPPQGFNTSALLQPQAKEPAQETKIASAPKTANAEPRAEK
jgi:pimeloyl-ACP methyl ester carboxylesterase